MNNCLFCEIIEKKRPADIIWENEASIVFKDINPKAPVHLLVVPRKHIGSIKDISEADKDIVSGIVYTARDIAEKNNLSGYKLIFNVGREGGQVIEHLHLHLLGGWAAETDRSQFPV